MEQDSCGVSEGVGVCVLPVVLQTPASSRTAAMQAAAPVHGMKWGLWGASARGLKEGVEWSGSGGVFCVGTGES